MNESDWTRQISGAGTTSCIGRYLWQTICFKMGVNFWRIDSPTLALNSGAKALNSAVKSINSAAKSINSGAKSINGGGTRMNEPAT